MIKLRAFAQRNAIAVAVVAGAAGLLLSSHRLQASEADRADANWAQLYAAGQPAPAARPARTATAAGVPAVAEPSEMGSIRRRVTEVAARHGVPANLALAVARLESNMRCQARGRQGELGPMQIKPATARGLGYTGPASALNSCGAGLEWGMRHLAVAYQRCGSASGAAALHNRGLGASCGRTAYSARVTQLMASL
ncbi:transglycosylase SLT domain-containing protein [Phreatobacter sp.]|uniref:transglycosylase SLT domain-containing protein n=1 Tax=Phreatobacter sp. TaxID=1966341 RepID=UPI0022BCAD60|nr:transglycosylase SLT domain-containing protein [Phreatobacter sp.]MCZ8313648.1 transglycosylase SLT domain-containing protein [Phreatobacter sp.]